MTVKWEYKCAQSPSGGIMNIDELNRLGKEGWEVVAVYKVGNMFEYLLKRPIVVEII